MRLEEHRHSYVRGPLSERYDHSFDHAHDGGDRPHLHPDTGPAAYTIDRGEWRAATGLRGGGRKVHRRRPTGPALPLVDPDPEHLTFTVVFCDRGLTPEHVRAGVTELDLQRMRDDFRAAAAGTRAVPDADGRPGGGGAAVARVALGFGMTPVYVYEDRRGEVDAAPAPRPDPHAGSGVWGML